MNYVKYNLLLLLLFVAGPARAASVGQLINYPVIKDVTLENGLRVMLIEHHEQPTVSYRILVRAGRIDNPLTKEGLADVTTRLLREGTRSMTSDDIADKIAEIGGDFTISSRANYTIFGMDVLSQYSDLAFAIFTDIILNPSFSSKGLQRVKKELIAHVKLELTNNYKIAFRHGGFLLFGSQHPLGHTKTEKSLNRIRTADVKDFYQKNFRPNNSILLVVGDFSADKMLAEITERLSSWPSAEIVGQIQIQPDFTKKGRIRVVNKPDMTQAVIHLNQWAPLSSSPDYYEYLLMNDIMGGGGFTSRLMQALRTKGGKTYGIGSYCSINLNYGVLGITTSTRNQEIFNTYQLIQSELKKLIDEGVTEEETIKTKAYMTGTIPLQLEAPGSMAEKILKAIMNGFTVDDLSKEIIYYNRVTAGDINRVIKKYLHPESFNVVIVGDIKKIKGQLEKIGPYEQVYYKHPLTKEPSFFRPPVTATGKQI